MRSAELVFSRRAWATETTLGHFLLWGDKRKFELPADRFNGRGYAQEQVELLRWGRERGINSIYIIHGDRGGYIETGGILLEEEAIRLKIPFSVGGHVWHGYPYLLPKSLFDRRPELFRMDSEKRRTPTGNFCTSNPEGLGRAVGELTKLLDRHPGAGVIQVWAEDSRGGSWCACPQCKDRSATQQLATLISAAAGAMEARKPGIELGFLLYHDTLTGLPEKGVSADGRRFVPPNVYGMFAPRERCYAHAIDDPACPRNRIYWENLIRAKEVFEGRVDVFEYYGDTILWHYFNMAIPHVIAGDLRAYRKLGVREVQALTFGMYSVWAHGLNLAVFAWLSSGMETDADSAIERYANERFGAGVAGRMVEYYHGLEEAQKQYLGICRHTEDPMIESRRFFGDGFTRISEKSKDLDMMFERLSRLAEILSEVEAGCSVEPFLANLRAERAHLEISRMEVELIRLELKIGKRTWTKAENKSRQDIKRRQWEIGMKVPEAIRGQGFGAEAS